MRSSSSSAGVVVLVTGCSKGGIGYALCQQLASRGCTVYATARKLGLLDGLQQQGCRLLELDVTDTAAAKRVVAQVLREAGQLDILVNNAGSAIKGWAVETPLADVRQLMEVNFFAVVALTQAVAPYMINQRSGLIVNIGSISSYLALPTSSFYSSSKFAIRGFCDALRVELAPFGVQVMHVAPGFVKTNLLRSNTVVGLREDSPYSQFKLATARIQHNDLEGGFSGWGATDPQVFAARLARVMLAPGRKPPHYRDAWLWWVFYLLGCFFPLWLVDLVYRVWFGLFSFLAR